MELSIFRMHISLSSGTVKVRNQEKGIEQGTIQIQSKLEHKAGCLIKLRSPDCSCLFATWLFVHDLTPPLFLFQLVAGSPVRDHEVPNGDPKSDCKGKQK